MTNDMIDVEYAMKQLQGHQTHCRHSEGHFYHHPGVSEVAYDHAQRALDALERVARRLHDEYHGTHAIASCEPTSRNLPPPPPETIPAVI